MFPITPSYSIQSYRFLEASQASQMPLWRLYLTNTCEIKNAFFCCCCWLTNTSMCFGSEFKSVWEILNVLHVHQSLKLRENLNVSSHPSVVCQITEKFQIIKMLKKYWEINKMKTWWQSLKTRWISQIKKGYIAKGCDITWKWIPRDLKNISITKNNKQSDDYL